MFVCYGNICRSPMAEFIMKDYVDKLGEQDNFVIQSCATSTEEIGNGVHRGTRAVLDRLNISYAGKHAVQLKRSDYDNYDYFVGMDQMNRRDMKRMLGGDPENKVSLLLDYTSLPRDVADPWYTGDFESTYNDIIRGVKAFYEYIKNKERDS